MHVLLITHRDVDSGSAGLLCNQVLGLIEAVKGVTEDLLFSTEVVSKMFIYTLYW